MKLYEKIILTIFAIGFLLQFFAFSEKRPIFASCTLLVSLSYLIGGYWLFNTKQNRNTFLSIISGIAFSAVILFLPEQIWLKKEPFHNYIPIANAILFINLFVYLVIKRKSDLNLKNIKRIFLRSFIILVITSFFYYVPMSFKPYLKIIYVLNNGFSYLQENVLMFDYSYKCEDAHKKGNFNMAIEYALKSNEAGKKWLGIENIKNPDKNDLSYISGSYFRIYNAYKSLANNKFRNKNIKEALDNYIVAHDYLTACNPDSEYWQEEISWSLNSIGICYTSLKDYEKADSVFLLAINNYEKLNNPSEELLLYLLRNTAISLFEQREYDYSTELFKSANYILLKDPLNHDNKEMLISNYNYISVNSISQDKLSDAMINVEEALLLGNKEEKSYCLSTLYYGLIYCKLDQYYKADSILKESLDCYKAISESNNQDIAECYLALSRINISLAKYKNAEKYLNLGIEITKNNYGTKSSRYANYLKTLAQLNKITGNYNSAEKQCYEVIDIYTKELGANNNKLPEILLELAELETILSKPNLAKMHSDNSLFIMNEYDTVLTPTYSIFFNNVAYIDYYTRFYNSADSLYRKVIEINYNFGLYNNTTIANALNGMGLLETKKRNYIKADSLFNESLKILKKIFIDSHPSIANIYLNKGVLFTLQGKLTEAEVFIKQAFEINNHFFEKDHDIFADIYVALGDIKKIGHHNETAKDYYRQALEIYKKHFDDKHLKIISVKNKIQN